MARAGGAAAALTVPGLLAACGTTQPLPAPGEASGQIRGQGPGGLALARPNVPVSLPIYPDNKPIASGLKPEKGPLQFYNWQEYINQDVVNSFQKKYNVEVQISTFTTLDEAVAKIESQAVQYDLFCPETPDLEQLVVGKLLRAAEPRLHPQPRGQRLADPGQPLVRLRQPVHGPVHRLHDRLRLAQRQAAGLQPRELRQPVERPVDRGAEDPRPDRDARRPARRDGAGTAAHRHDRRQHR